MFSSVVLMRTETMSIGFKLMKFGLGFNYIFANETSWQKKNKLLEVIIEMVPHI